MLGRKILLIGIAVTFLACTKVPITGRESLQFVPDSKLASYAVQQYDETLKNWEKQPWR